MKPGRSWSWPLGATDSVFGHRARGPSPCDARGPKTEPVAPGDVPSRVETASTEAIPFPI
jgi:hypothetical protein